MAAGLIAPGLRNQRILDLGCGSYPFFLLNTTFAEKFGLDQVVEPGDIEKFKKQNITLAPFDFHANHPLPFDDEYFAVVTALALFEHIETEKLLALSTEIHRVLRKGGMLIITTPAPWSDKLLKVMAKLHLVSPEEIDEHKCLAKHSTISSILQLAGFPEDKLQFGYFEMFLNTWTTAQK